MLKVSLAFRARNGAFVLRIAYIELQHNATTQGLQGNSITLEQVIPARLQGFWE